MIDDDTILSVLLQLDPETKRLPSGLREFAHAIYALGRNVGLEEASQACDRVEKASREADQLYGTRENTSYLVRAIGASECAKAIRALKENKS